MNIEKRKSRYYRKCYRCEGEIKPKEEYYSIRGFLDPVIPHSTFSTRIYSWTPFCVLCAKQQYGTAIQKKEARE